MGLLIERYYNTTDRVLNGLELTTHNELVYGSQDTGPRHFLPYPHHPSLAASDGALPNMVCDHLIEYMELVDRKTRICLSLFSAPLRTTSFSHFYPGFP